MAQETIWTWSLPENISNTPGSSRFPRVATDAQGGLHVVWSENLDTAPGAWGNAIYYTRQQNGQWSAPIDIVYSGRGVAHLPAIAVDEEAYVHLIWTDGSHLYHQHAPVSTAHTAQGWSARQTISWDGFEAAYWSDIVSAGSTIHVAWSGGRELSGEIVYTRSEDGGDTWISPVRVTETYDVAETRPNLLVDHEGTVHLLWGQNKQNDDPIGPLMYSRAVGEPVWEIPEPASAFPGFSDLGVFAEPVPGQLHVIWQQGAEWHSSVTDPRHGLYHRWSEDGGTTWNEPKRISRGWSYLDVAVDSASRLHLVWSEPSVITSASLEDQGVYYGFWNGRRWSAPLSLAASQGDARPQIAVTEGNILNVVWAKGDIFYSRAVTDAPNAAPVASLPPPTRAPAASTPPTVVVTPTPQGTPTAFLTPIALTFPTDPPDTDVSRPGWTPFLVSLGSVSALLLVTVVLVRGKSRRGSR